MNIKKDKGRILRTFVAPIHRRPLFFRLTNRATLFFLLLSASLLLFFVTGNYQQFLDSDQHIILVCCTVSEISLFIFSFFSFIEAVYCIFTVRKKNKWLFILHAVILFIICTAAAILSFTTRTIIFLSAGIQQQL